MGEAEGSQGDLAEAERQAAALLDAGERGAAAAAQLNRSALGAAQTQQEVEVDRGVHGVKDVGVVRDHQLWGQKNGVG